MKRGLLIVGLLAVLVLAFAALRPTRPAPAPPPSAGASLSEEQRGRIRRFWHVYGQATQARVQGDWDAAVEAYQRALELDADHEDALYYLGNALFEVGRYEGAAASWDRLLQVNDRSARAHAQLGAVYSCGAAGAPFDLDRAQQAYEAALSINKEESAAVIRLGEIALLKGERARALDYLTAGRRANSRSAAAHYLAGYLQWRTGDRPAALEALRQAVACSRGAPAGPSASSEGETRSPGAGPLLAAGARRKSLLAPHWQALKTWAEAEVTEARMEREYRGLDERLEAVP